jgi:hypothetical protein
MTQPNETWDLDRLARYVVSGLEKIGQLDAEVNRLARRTAVETHRIGHALAIVQKKTKPFGQWTKWLAKHGIPRMTAWEAIKLYESASEEEIATLTITEAKVKFGIYPEFMPKEEEETATVAARSAGTAPERQLVLACRRLTTVLEQLAEMKWKKELLYAPETDELLEFCQQVVKTISERRKKVRRPKREDTTCYLAELRSA